MSKKQQSVKVQLEEKEVQGQTIQQVFIAKNLVGEITPQQNEFATHLIGGGDFVAKSLDDAVEWVLQEYNLHQ
ncbi:DUF2969 domain-containing protein [Pediococcus inopinatus]|uniref:DUF2969 domain-containing protein n=1 Tax=Pediococcus inopinatus TaxID=114090 RepID=A0ABZ0Q2P6_9LACO|nr:DUF2969 domain-containing protein [Pediococcus inopinatus]AVL00299.1 hypothetical protein PI20285_06455 [Pediococcus inopinatus]WPC17961.1 DUF2969 domain-containing protein [Pediococcus inopinatus]WPC19511.1 DUF2969 domain-containing protein [Pediococcus inopinatus]WPC21211.1 DUF2969 domain-containing protein [Pediococcus inopinatus]WPP09862.1 DUF2969 domain-containing protein [Pediococcus inopinatus]